MSLSASFLPEFDMEMANTRKMLEAVPDAHFDYKPHAKSFSMGDLASHIANTIHWGTVTLTEADYDFAPDGVPQEDGPRAQNRAELLANFETNVAAFRAALETSSDSDLMQPWSLLTNGTPMFTMPRVAVLRSFIFNHTYHHRGQLGVYLRMNDIPVPGVYGPTADEQPG